MERILRESIFWEGRSGSNQGSTCQTQNKACLSLGACLIARQVVFCGSLLWPLTCDQMDIAEGPCESACGSDTPCHRALPCFIAMQVPNPCTVCSLPLTTHPPLPGQGPTKAQQIKVNLLPPRFQPRRIDRNAKDCPLFSDMRSKGASSGELRRRESIEGLPIRV